MDYLLIAKLGWGFVKKWSKSLAWFFSTTIGKIVLVLALGIAYGQYQHHVGVAETNASWVKKWNAHIANDQHDAKLRKEANDRAVAANKALANTQVAIITDLQKKLAAETARKDKVHTIIKEVTKYVTPKADAAAVIPAGFVWMHNLAASYAPTDTSPFSDRPPGDVDAPSGVALSTVAAVVDYNYAECNSRGALLDLWQAWYAKEHTAWDQYRATADPPPTEVNIR